jgi:hypothetical protein
VEYVVFSWKKATWDSIIHFSDCVGPFRWNGIGLNCRVFRQTIICTKDCSGVYWQEISVYVLCATSSLIKDHHNQNRNGCLFIICIITTDSYLIRTFELRETNHWTCHIFLLEFNSYNNKLVKYIYSIDLRQVILINQRYQTGHNRWNDGETEGWHVSSVMKDGTCPVTRSQG